MAGIKINSIYEATVYKNGNSLYGQAKEVKISGVKPTLKEHQALGIMGKIRNPMGFEEMTLELDMNSVYPDSIKDAANIYKEQLFIVYGNLETYEGDAKVGEVKVKYTLRGRTSDNKGLDVKHQDASETGETYTLSAITLEIDGKEIYAIDLQANIYRVDGNDLWEQRRINLGL